MKLSLKILLLFLAMTIITAGSAMYFVFLSLHSTIKKEMGKQQLQITRQIMEEIDIFLFERLQNIKTIGQAPPVIQALVAANEKSLVVANKKLSEFFNSTGPWNNLVVLNTKGDVVISTYEIQDISKRPGIEAAFRSAIKNQIYYSDAVLSLATGKPTVFFAYPMKNIEAVGTPIVGVVVGELSWPAIIEYLEKIQEPLLIHLYNNSGIVIGSNQFEHQEEILKTSFKNSPAVQSALKGDNAAKETLSVHGDFNSLTTSANEQGHLTYKGNNWILILEEPASIVFASAQASALNIGWLSGALITFYFCFLYFLIQRIFIRRITEISSVMEKIALGNLGLRMEVKTKDEIGKLIKSFNVMVDNLKESHEKLEQKVRDRTQDLENANIAARNVLEDLRIEKETLANAKAKNEALLESIGEGVVAVDQKGKIILINWAAERMLGYTTEQAVGRLPVEMWKVLDEKGNLISEEKRPIAIALKGKTTTTTTTTTTTGPSYFYTRKNGASFPVAVIVTPVIVNGEIIGAIDIFRDITKEKEIEKLRMDFLSLASHQLRTPLSGTKWLIGTMQRGILGKMSKRQKEYLGQIYQINERMIQLVSEMLSALRLESGTEPVEKETILVADIYKDISISMMTAAKSNGIILYSALKEGATATINTDKGIFKSIIECFISNAINYSKSGQKVVLDMEEEEFDMVFSVRDDGIGIPKEEQKKIFEKFYRASNAKDFKPGGSGLGLNITKMLAEKIGAEISFKSKEGKGSTFYLRIPK